MSTKIDKAAIAKLDAAAKALGLPSYTDLACALCDVLDGTPNHDIASDLGLSEGDTAAVITARDGVKQLWKNFHGIA